MAASVPVVPMDRGNNTTCTINLHGATIVSWRVNNQVRSGHLSGTFWGVSPPHSDRHVGMKLYKGAAGRSLR